MGEVVRLFEESSARVSDEVKYRLISIKKLRKTIVYFTGVRDKMEDDTERELLQLALDSWAIEINQLEELSL